MPATTVINNGDADKVPGGNPPAIPAPFILLADDGASRDVYEAIVYMGDVNQGNDGSMSVNVSDDSQKKIGDSSMRFTYKTPGGKSHWAGMMMLFTPGVYKDDPGSKGPDLELYSQYTFWVKGRGGDVKFYIECEGGEQDTAYVKLTDEWRQITLSVNDSWRFCNIPFGWTCNAGYSDTDGGTIEFWCDGMQFE